jgi:hypothetical protein
MPDSANELSPQSSAPQWSNRILVAAIAGILFLTLYPFRLGPHTRLPGTASPFLLNGGMGKNLGALDAFLNVLLFVPFGFGLTEKLRSNRKGRAVCFVLVYLSGALFSYGIELTQNWVPGRDSGWADVITNSSGAVVGFLLFEICGRIVLEILSVLEAVLDTFLTWRAAAVLLLIYFAACFTVSAHFQKKTRLSNWDPHCLLLIGNGADARPSTGWMGEIFSLQVWDRALPDAVAEALTAGKPPDAAPPGLLGAYDFSGHAPFQDRLQFLPSVSWTPAATAQSAQGEPSLDGSQWLASSAPASNLIAALQRTNAFAIRVVCKPGQGAGAGSPIVSISRPGVVDLAIRQDDANLVFWFRNALSVKHSYMQWTIPNVFSAVQSHDILYSYDGSNLSLFIDGRKEPVYELGPAPGFVHTFMRIKTIELQGYLYAYYALVFVPAGILLGALARTVRPDDTGGWLFFILSLVIPGLLLEAILAAVSGRASSLGYAALSLIFTACGAIWMNLDPPPADAPENLA